MTTESVWYETKGGSVSLGGRPIIMNERVMKNSPTTSTRWSLRHDGKRAEIANGKTTVSRLSIIVTYGRRKRGNNLMCAGKELERAKP